MNRNGAAALALPTCIVLVLLVAGVGTVAGVTVSIVNVSVTPEQPAPGELVTFTMTLQNEQSSSTSFRINSIALREQSGSMEYARAENLGDVTPGSTTSVPLTTSFETAGVKNLRLVVSGESVDEGGLVLSYPATVVVSDRTTQLSVDVEEPVVGATTAVNVTVSNGGADPIRQIDLRLGGDGVQTESSRRLLARLDAGADRSFTYDVTFTEAGPTTLEAVLRYAGTSGQTQVVRQNQTVTVDELREDVSVEASVDGAGGASPPLSVEVTNFGNAPLEDVSLRVADGDRTVARRSVETVEAGSAREVTLNLTGVDDADLDVTVAYETGGVAGEASTAVRYSSRPGRIAITGVDFSREGGVTTISGSASNVGLAEANSVVLRVLPAEGVEPVAPNREYFVGTVPASDFVSFDLTARIDDDVASIPVRVTYLADGVERTEEVSIPYEPPATVEGEATGGGGLGLVGSAVLLVAVVAVAAGGVLWWRRREGGGG